MKLPFPTPSHGTPHYRPTWCAQLAPKPAIRFQARLKLSLPPHANYNRIHPAFIFANSGIGSRSLSTKPNTIEYA
jgi:hypothetical protein